MLGKWSEVVVAASIKYIFGVHSLHTGLLVSVEIEWAANLALRSLDYVPWAYVQGDINAARYLGGIEVVIEGALRSLAFAAVLQLLVGEAEVEGCGACWRVRCAPPFVTDGLEVSMAFALLL